MDKIRVIREQNKISQKELGRYLGVAQNSVSNWEKGTRLPDYETLKKIAEKFNVSCSYLLDEGIFQQKDLVLELREPLTYIFMQLIGDKFENVIKNLNDESFINQLSMFIKKIEFDSKTGELTVNTYYDLPNINMNVNAPFSFKEKKKKSKNAIPHISGIDESGKYVDKFSKTKTLEIIRDLANLPDESIGDLKILFQFLESKYIKKS